MAKAMWKGVVLADSDQTVMVEGNHYFPADSINMDYFQKNSQTSSCPWKGTANYYDVSVDSETNRGAAWVYENPHDAAKKIKGHLAFWRGIEVA